MRYSVEYDNKTFALSIRELNVVVSLGSLKENMRRLRELVPFPSVLVYPYMGTPNFHEDWSELSKEVLTEPRMGQEGWEREPPENEEQPLVLDTEPEPARKKFIKLFGRNRRD